MNSYAVLIPAYKPMPELADYVRELISGGAGLVLVVNDGSPKSDQDIFKQVDQIPNCQVIGYDDNRGKGMALKYGFSYLFEHYRELVGVVTADADGQHRVEDVVTIGEHLCHYDASYIIGMRDFSQDHVPLRSWLGNRLTTIMFYLFFGKWVKDTQTGLRGIKMEELPEVIQLPGERFDYEINILIMIAICDKSYQMVHIHTVYAEDHSSHYDTWHDSVLIGRQMIRGLRLKKEGKKSESA